MYDISAAREILNAPELLPHRRCYTLISLRCGGEHKGGAKHILRGAGAPPPCPPLDTPLVQGRINARPTGQVPRALDERGAQPKTVPPQIFEASGF